MINAHEFTIESQTGQRIITPYTQWMLQRALNYLHSLNRESRNAALELLGRVGDGF